MAKNDFEEFCGSEFWNESLLLDNTWPQFTDCIMHTALTWVPCAFLWVMLPYYIYSVKMNSSGAKFTCTFFVLFKLVCCVFLVMTSLVQLSDKVANVVKWSDASWVGDIVWLASYLLMAVMTECERRHGVQGLGVPFFFWLLTSLCHVISLYTVIKLEAQERKPLYFTVTIIAFVLQVTSVCLTFFVDRLPLQNGADEKAPCPETTCSFPAFLCFWWMTKLVVTGYRRDLKENDLWQLNPSEQSDTLVPVFMRAWTAEASRCHQDSLLESAGDSRSSSVSLFTHSKSTETTPLALDKLNCRPARKRRTSLLRVLAKMFWWDLLVSFLLKVLSDVIFFLSPVFLSLLIHFLAVRESGREWQGYVLCLGLFLCCSTKAVLFGHSLFRATRVGIRIKSVLVGAIFRKVLKLNNGARSRVTAGGVVNMMAVDAQQIMEQIDTVFFGITTPVQLVLAVLILYHIIGWAVFVGVGVLVLQVPINGLVARKQKQFREGNLACKDRRVKLFAEILNAIKVLKLYAWEQSFREKIRDVRHQEMSYLFKNGHTNSILGLIWDMAPYMVTLATYATYIVSEREHQLTATVAFVSLAFFNILRAPLNKFATIIVFAIQCFVSIGRINKFLDEEELDPDNVTHDSSAVHAITIENGTFKWDRKGKACLSNINLTVSPGRLVAVVGPVGCGKSSLISAILGEMEKKAGTVKSKGSMAYVPQQPWIQNASLRDNVLFGRPFNMSRYSSVLQHCQLEHDLHILPAGDLTEIGEKGINLSGAQKQRVSVGRAVYSDSDVYLLDDPLSAVDSHVGKALFKQVIGHAGVLKSKTRVLVTHGVHWLPMVDDIIVMNEGKITERGSYEELISHNGPFAQFLNTYLTEAQAEPDPEIASIRREMKERLEKSLGLSSSGDIGQSGSCDGQRSEPGRRWPVLDSLTLSLVQGVEAEEEEERRGEGRLTTAESVEIGKVKAKVFGDFMRAAGVTPLLVSFLAYCAFQALAVSASFLLDRWARDWDLKNVSARASPQYNDRNDFFLTVYGLYGVGQVLCLALFHWLYWTRMVHAACEMHARLANRILHYPMAFFHSIPTARVLNRVSRDVETVDNWLPLIVRDFVIHASLVAVTVIVIVIVTPVSAAVIFPVIILYFLCQKFYIPTSRQLKRIESVTRTPIYVTLCEAMNGASSIRAYGSGERLLKQAKFKVDHNQVTFFASHGAVRWLQWNLDLMASIIIFATAVFEVLSSSADDGNAGLSVAYALQLSGTLIWMTCDVCEFETHIASVERLREYSELHTEGDWILPAHRPPSSWPDKGEVIFHNVQMRYREGLDLALRDVSFRIAPGEKVGIMGRSGAGKTSLILALFRLVEIESGSIVIDDINVASVGLHDLRSHLTILPQEPVLFSGTLRMNLDPFDEYGDGHVWAALEQAHLRQAVEEFPGGLYFHCGEEGSNLSVGQRQLVCLARTLLRRTKILVLDEATAAVDMETDALIQKTIRSAFSTCTVITIAHRLNTELDYDRILVLEAGSVKEFASPQELLSDSTSTLYSMARDAGLA